MSVKALFLLAAGSVLGVLDAMPLPSLISQADAIVVGAETAPVTAGKTVTFYLTVERVFTGAIGQGSTVNVVWNSDINPDAWAGSPSYRGIWFLRKGAGNEWQCVPAAIRGNVRPFSDLSLPVSNGPLPPQLAYDDNTTPLLDKLVFEVGASQPSDPTLFRHVTSGVSSPAVLKALRYLASSQSTGAASAGLAGLIERGDVAALLQAEKILANLSPGDSNAGVLSSAIFTAFRTPDPEAVASLGRMASGKGSPRLQVAAAAALAAIHSADAVPWLGSLLSDSQQQVQIYGAQGLSFFANGVGIPTAETTKQLTHLNERQPTSYRTAETDRHIGPLTGQPEPFLDFWRGWWQQHPELHAQQ